MKGIICILMEDYQTADMPVKPGAVSLYNKPETLIEVGFQEIENVAVSFDIAQLQLDFILW